MKFIFWSLFFMMGFFSTFLSFPKARGVHATRFGARGITSAATATRGRHFRTGASPLLMKSKPSFFLLLFLPLHLLSSLGLSRQRRVSSSRQNALLSPPSAEAGRATPSFLLKMPPSISSQAIILSLFWAEACTAANYRSLDTAHASC